MQLCTCPLGDYPELLLGSGAQICALVLIGLLWAWWLFEISKDIRKHSLGTMLAKGWALLRGPKELSPIERKVLERFHRTRFERYQWYLSVLKWIGAPGIVGVVAFIVGISTFQPAQLPRFITSRTTLEGVLITIYSLYFSTFKHHLSTRVADVAFSFVFLALGAHTYFANTNYEYLTISRLVYSGQVTLSVAIGDSKRVVPLNLVSTLWQVLVIYLTPALHDDWFSVGIDLAISSIFNTGFAIFTETWLMKEARAIVGEMQASRSQANVQNLLTVMCDAVVELHSDFTVKSGGQGLHAMLLRQPLPVGSEAPSFTKYMAEDDISRFQTFVDACLTQPGFSHMLHVNLIDAIGTSVKVQLFHTSVTDLDDKANHWLGITEERGQERDFFPQITSPRSDTPPMRQLDQCLQLEPVDEVSSETMSRGSSRVGSYVEKLAWAAAGLTMQGLRGTSDAESVSSGSSSRSGGTARGPALSNWGLEEPSTGMQMKVFWRVVGAMKPTVVEESPGASTLFAFGTGEGWKDFLKNFEEGDQIHAWLTEQLRIRLTMRGGNQWLFGPVSVTGPASVYKAELVLEFPQEEGPKDDSCLAHTSFCLRLLPEKTKRKKKKQKQGAQKRGTPAAAIATDKAKVTI